MNSFEKPPLADESQKNAIEKKEVTKEEGIVLNFLDRGFPLLENKDPKKRYSGLTSVGGALRMCELDSTRREIALKVTSLIADKYREVEHYATQILFRAIEEIKDDKEREVIVPGIKSFESGNDEEALFTASLAMGHIANNFKDEKLKEKYNKQYEEMREVDKKRYAEMEHKAKLEM